MPKYNIKHTTPGFKAAMYGNNKEEAVTKFIDKFNLEEDDREDIKCQSIFEFKRIACKRIKTKDTVMGMIKRKTKLMGTDPDYSTEESTEESTKDNTNDDTEEVEEAA